MNCRHVQERLHQDPLRTGSAGDSAVGRHLQACAECRRVADQCAGLEALLQRYPGSEPPPGLFHGVRNILEAERPPRRVPALWLWLCGRAGQGLALTAALGAVAAALLVPVPTHNLPSLAVHPDVVNGRQTSALASSIRLHAISAGRGAPEDRIAWEAMARLVERRRQGVVDLERLPDLP